VKPTTARSAQRAPHRSVLGYLRLPLSAAPMMVLVLFTAGFTFFARGGLLALIEGRIPNPLAILGTAILASWFFKYCFALLDAAISGAAEPPVLSVEIVSPFEEQRPLAQLALIGLGVFAARAAGRSFGVLAALAAAGVLLALLPASLAVMGITSNPLRAAWPPALLAVTRALGRRYAAVWLALALCGAALYGLWHLTQSFALLAAGTQLTLLEVFAVIGGAVHEERFALGLETQTREDRESSREAREHDAERAAMLDESYGHARLGRLTEALSMLDAWIARHCADERGFAEYTALLAASSRWEEPKLADRIAERYLTWLLRRGETGRAVDALEQHLRNNPTFRPREPAQAARLAELAVLAGKRTLSQRLRSPGPDGAKLEPPAAAAVTKVSEDAAETHSPTDTLSPQDTSSAGDSHNA